MVNPNVTLPSIHSGPAAGRGEILQARKDARVGIDVPCQLYSSQFEGPLRVRSLDLSIRGQCLESSSVLALDSIRRIVVHLPKNPIDLEARGRWQRESPADDAFLTGIEFLRPSPGHMMTLWESVLDGSKNLTRFLYGQPDLSEFSVEDVMGLAQVSRFRNVPSGRLIYRQDTATPDGESVFLVHSGCVSLSVRVADARDEALESLGPGRLFGGLPLIAEAPHVESALASGRTRLLEIDRGAYVHLRAVRPWLAERLAQAVVRSYGRRVRDVIARAAR